MSIPSLRPLWLSLAAGAVASAAMVGCTRPAPESSAAVVPDPAGQPPAVPRPAPGGPTASPATSKALVRVNGVAITEDDVRLALRLRSPQEPIPADKQAAVLETLIREELVAQRAAALGLDKNDGYLAEQAKMDAQVQALRRRALGDLYFKAEVEAKVTVDAAAVERYFEANKSKLSTELHILQILVRRDSDAFAAVEKLKAGKKFAEVAREGFAVVPDENAPPWDLGWMKWRQIPEPWREVVYDLQPGQHSGVIAGPRGRYWVVQVEGRRDSALASLADLRPQIAEELKSQQVEALRAGLDAEVRRGARIER